MIDARQSATLAAIQAHQRCRRLYVIACFRRRGPTPQPYKAALVARAAAVREFAA